MAESENAGFRPQVSFKNGKEVPKNKRGSVRPEGYKVGETIEVKNYDITTSSGKSNLIRDIVKQVRRRTANLPAGTHQKIVLDMRGQNLKGKELFKTYMEVRNRILSQTGTSNVSISGRFGQ